MLQQITFLPLIFGMATSAAVAAPLRLPVTVKPFDSVKLIGPPRQNQELRMEYQGDPSNTAKFACYRDGVKVAGLSQRLRSYRTSIADVGKLVECSLTDASGGFEMRSPPVGPIRSGNLGPEDEIIRVEDLHSIPDGAYSKVVKNLRHMPSVVTYHGATYFIYVDENLFPMVGKVAPGREVTEYRLESDDAFKVVADGHHNFSIGVDSEGYLHVAGNMHRYTGRANSAAEKKPAEKISRPTHFALAQSDPEDVSQFDFKGQTVDGTPEGTGFTYTAFKSGMDAELYMRARVNLGRSTPFRHPLSAWALYKYDPVKKAWNAIEGDIDREKYGAYLNFTPRAFLWEDNGNDGFGYQGYLSGMMIDFDNNIHIASAVNNDDGPAATHIVYARSNDGGVSWERSNGTAINALPLRVDAGPGQADIISSPKDNPNGFYASSSVCEHDRRANCDERKYESATDSGFEQGKFRVYDDRIRAWQSLQPDPFDATNDTSVVTDVNGIVTMMHHKGHGRTYRMYDGEVTGYEKSVMDAYGLSGHDERALREKAAIIGLGYWSKSGDAPGARDLKLFSIKTDLTGIPLPELEELEQQNEGDWKWKRTQIGGKQGAVTIANNIFKFTGTGEGFDDQGLKSLQYTHKIIRGDFELKARVVNIDFTDPKSFAGLMVANDLGEESDAVSAYITAGEGMFTHKQINGERLPLNFVRREASEWLKFTRIGGLVRVYHGSNNKDWKLLSETFVASLNPQVHVGLINGGGGKSDEDSTEMGIARIDNIQLFKM